MSDGFERGPLSWMGGAKQTEAERAARIAQLNDELRTATNMRNGQVFFSHGVTTAENLLIDAVTAVQQFRDFNKDNDPYGEHDFGSVEVNGQKVFWKIDYYSEKFPDEEVGSEDPANPDKTTRVLTIMLAEEY